MAEINVVGIFSDTFWYIAPIIVTITTTITGFLNQLFNVEKNGVKQAIAWGTAAVLSVVSWAIGAITFGQPVWVGILALCVVTGLSSNGFYDIEVIKKTIKTWFPSKIAIEK